MSVPAYPEVDGVPASVCGGIFIRAGVGPDPRTDTLALLQQLTLPDLAPHVLAKTVAQAASGNSAQGGTAAGTAGLHLRLKPDCVQAWAPGLDTLGLCAALQLDSINKDADLLREIVIAMLMGPIAFEFPTVDELLSAVRIRANIVRAARKTTLDFQTNQAERPPGHWTYDEDRGYTLLPGAELIEALTLATQPEVSGALYSFSCYRATEYVTLLGIAQELQNSNPALLAQLQARWQRSAIQSGEFHEVFLREQGSMEAPLPPRYFVPGDRTWFRNPDGASANASGFEGSWIMYLGNGLFSNFWQHDKPYTLEAKCLEIYHWRHGVYLDAQGDERMDEAKVATLVAATQQDPVEVARIMALMGRYREPRGVYTDAGGCMDSTREFARWVRPGTADLVLPAL